MKIEKACTIGLLAIAAGIVLHFTAPVVMDLFFKAREEISHGYIAGSDGYSKSIVYTTEGSLENLNSHVSFLDTIYGLDLDDVVTVIINSNGGLAQEGLLLFRGLKDTSAKVIVVIPENAVAASAAAFVACAADEVKMEPNSRLMFHLASYYFMQEFDQNAVKKQYRYNINLYRETLQDCKLLNWQQRNAILNGFDVWIDHEGNTTIRNRNE